MMRVVSVATDRPNSIIYSGGAAVSKTEGTSGQELNQEHAGSLFVIEGLCTVTLSPRVRLLKL